MGLVTKDGSDVRKKRSSGASTLETSGEVRALNGAKRVVAALDDLMALYAGTSVLRPDREHVSSAMSRVTAEAHSVGLQPEELILLLKSAWNSRPSAMRQDRDTQEDQLTSLVTLCIKTYFAPPRAER